MSERKRYTARTITGEEQARALAGSNIDRHILALTIDSRRGQLMREPDLSETLSGAYEVRIEVTPIDEPGDD